ncbi:MAG: hypothetical protein HY859_16430 [Caulobacterales bacterium]|nr:hypothetical protein [Caulobacterales bacterium]
MRLFNAGFCTALLGGLVACSAETQDHNPDYRSLGWDSTSAFYFDRASIARKDDIAEVDVVIIAAPISGATGAPHRVELGSEIDCARGKSRTRSVTELDITGKVIGRSKPNPQWSFIDAGGGGDALRQLVCTDGAAEKKPVVADIEADAKVLFALQFLPKASLFRRLALSSDRADYLEETTITRTGAIARVWVATVHSLASRGDGAGAYFKKTLFDVDCSANRGAIVAAASYDLLGAGKSDSIYASPEWFSFDNGSHGQRIKDAVCVPDALKALPATSDYQKDAAERLGGRR